MIIRDRYCSYYSVKIINDNDTSYRNWTVCAGDSVSDNFFVGTYINSKTENDNYEVQYRIGNKTRCSELLNYPIITVNYICNIDTASATYEEIKSGISPFIK